MNVFSKQVDEIGKKCQNKEDETGIFVLGLLHK